MTVTEIEHEIVVEVRAIYASLARERRRGYYVGSAPKEERNQRRARVRSLLVDLESAEAREAERKGACA